MKLSILQYPDPRLATVAKTVEKFTPELKTLAENMVETMYEAEGIGLAAPQVGEFIRLIVLDISGKERNKLLVLVNPKLILLGTLVDSEEGCLSVPNAYRAKIKRANKVFVSAYDLEGNPLEFETSDLLAICLQHEHDHLEGKLFIDKMSRLKRSLYNISLKKEQKNT